MKIVCLALFFILASLSCNHSQRTAGDIQEAISPDTGTSWKFGIALWTFHDVNFPQSLDRVKQSGLTYIEPNTFHKTGAAFGDTMVGNLSLQGLEKLRNSISEKGLVCESIYLGGGPNLDSWVKDFNVARALGVKFVTCEPEPGLWDEIDSLASVHQIKVAIHEHWRGVSHYWHPDSVLAAMKNHPNFYVCADLGHWPKSGINPLEAVKKLSGRIIGVHFKDIAAYNDPKLKDVVAGTGVVQFPEILQELKRQNFTGNIYIERDSIERGGNLSSVIETVKYYNGLVKNLK